MATEAGGADSALFQWAFAMRDLWRIALWGLTAVGALALAVYATMTPTGRDRLTLATTHLREMVRPSGIKPIPPLNAKEGQQLAKSVRSLTADHSHMLTRVVRLENTVVEVAASIARVKKAMEAAPQPSKPPEPKIQVEPTTNPAAPADDVTSSIGREDTVQVPRPARAAPEATPDGVNRTEFGLDLGSANSIESLRALWATSLQRHAALLEGLRPIVHLRERPRAAPAELRLVAGPFANAAGAARVCAAMTAAGAVCQPALFDGQRLAIR